MTGAEKLFEALNTARLRHNGILTKPQWLQVVSAFLVEYSLPVKKARKVNVLGSGLTDEQWFTELGKDPDLAGVNIPEEARKCRVYFKGKCTPSRARILKWLSRADQTLELGTTAPSEREILQEPNDWRSRVRDRFPEFSALDPASRSYFESWPKMTREEKQQVIRIISGGRP